MSPAVLEQREDLVILSIVWNGRRLTDVPHHAKFVHISQTHLMPDNANHRIVYLRSQNLSIYSRSTTPTASSSEIRSNELTTLTLAFFTKELQYASLGPPRYALRD